MVRTVLSEDLPIDAPCLYVHVFQIPPLAKFPDSSLYIHPPTFAS